MNKYVSNTQLFNYMKSEILKMDLLYIDENEIKHLIDYKEYEYQMLDNKMPNKWFIKEKNTIYNRFEISFPMCINPGNYKYINGIKISRITDQGKWKMLLWHRLDIDMHITSNVQPYFAPGAWNILINS